MKPWVIAGAASILVATLSSGVSAQDPELALSIERDTYYVGEPVRLRLSVVNRGGSPVTGYFNLMSPPVKILFRRNEERFRPLFGELPTASQTIAGARDVVAVDWTLVPGHERRSELVVAWDAVKQRMLFEEAGDYEFYVACRLTGTTPSELKGTVQSNVARLGVAWPPAELREALSEYAAKGLARMLDYYYPFSAYESATVQSANTFLAQHPHGLYAGHVRKATTAVLQRRIARREASAKEKEIYKQLREVDRPE